MRDGLVMHSIKDPRWRKEMPLYVTLISNNSQLCIHGNAAYDATNAIRREAWSPARMTLLPCIAVWLNWRETGVTSQGIPQRKRTPIYALCWGEGGHNHAGQKKRKSPSKKKKITLFRFQGGQCTNYASIYGTIFSTNLPLAWSGYLLLLLLSMPHLLNRLISSSAVHNVVA